MTTSKHPRKTSLGKLAAGALVAVGMVMAAGSSAMADSWKHGNGHGYGHGKKHWKHSHYHYDYGRYHYYKPQRPKVIYVQPRPVYVAPRLHPALDIGLGSITCSRLRSIAGPRSTSSFRSTSESTQQLGKGGHDDDT